MSRTMIIGELFESMGALHRMLGAPQSDNGKDGHCPTRAQFGIMVTVAHEGPSGVKELADKLHMSSSAVTQLVDALAEQGLLSRKQDEGDRRKIDVALTAKGRTILKKAKKKRLAAMASLLKPLSETDLRQMSRILQKIVHSRLAA